MPDAHSTLTQALAPKNVVRRRFKRTFYIAFNATPGIPSTLSCYQRPLRKLSWLPVYSLLGSFSSRPWGGRFAKGSWRILSPAQSSSVHSNAYAGQGHEFNGMPTGLGRDFDQTAIPQSFGRAMSPALPGLSVYSPSDGLQPIDTSLLDFSPEGLESVLARAQQPGFDLLDWCQGLGGVGASQWAST